MLTSNNYNNYINNKIPFPNEIYKDSCSKNECKIVKKNFVLITSKVGSVVTFFANHKTLLVVLVFLLLMCLGIGGLFLLFPELFGIVALDATVEVVVDVSLEESGDGFAEEIVDVFGENWGGSILRDVEFEIYSF